jgi:hypothetical protein
MLGYLENVGSRFHSLRQITEKFIFPKALIPLGNPGVRALVWQGPPDLLPTGRSWTIFHQHVIGGGQGRRPWAASVGRRMWCSTQCASLLSIRRLRSNLERID